MRDVSYIYFLSNYYNSVLYVGVTNNLIRRIAEHKAKINRGFTYKYNCDKLVYYESFSLMTDAIAREKQIKNWKREWKNKLINDFNPEWKDLSKEIGIDEEYIEALKAEYGLHAETSSAFPINNKEIAGQARNDVVCSSSQPIGISEYQLSKVLPDNYKSALPSIEEIEAGLRNEN